MRKIKAFKISRKSFSGAAIFAAVVAVGAVAVLNFSRKADMAKALVDDAATFSYTGAPQIFTAPEAGNYEFEVWGAQGGDAALSGGNAGGKGGYAVGVYALAKGQKITVNVGGQGVGMAGGWNGGGNGSAGTAQDFKSTLRNDGAGGGGATDITVGADRVIVAGGGGGTGGKFNDGHPNDPVMQSGVSGGDSEADGDVSTSVGLQSNGGGGAVSTGGACGLATGSNVSGVNNDGIYSPGGAGGGGGGYFGGGGGAGGSRQGNSEVALGLAGQNGSLGAGGNGGAAAPSARAYYSTGGGGGGGGSSYAGGVSEGATYNGNQSFVPPAGGTEIGHSGDGFAKITQESLAATFTAGGGVGADSVVPAGDADEVRLPDNTFTKVGYTFAGWLAYDGATYQPGEVLTIHPNETFSATWKPNNYMIHFDANGGAGAMSDQGATYDQSAPLSANKFSRDGYRFTHWSADPDGESGDYFEDGQNVANLTADPDGAVTLYAQWTRTATLRWSINGVVVYQEEVDDGRPLGNDPGSLYGSPQVKPGYYVSGWYMNAALTEPYDPSLALHGTVTIYGKEVPLEPESQTITAGDAIDWSALFAKILNNYYAVQHHVAPQSLAISISDVVYSGDGMFTMKKIANGVAEDGFAMKLSGIVPDNQSPGVYANSWSAKFGADFTNLKTSSTVRVTPKAAPENPRAPILTAPSTGFRAK